MRMVEAKRERCFGKELETVKEIEINKQQVGAFRTTSDVEESEKVLILIFLRHEALCDSDILT